MDAKVSAMLKKNESKKRVPIRELQDRIGINICHLFDHHEIRELCIFVQRAEKSEAIDVIWDITSINCEQWKK